MWVLVQAAAQPLPNVGEPGPKAFAVARFLRCVDGRTATNRDGSQRHWGVYDAHSVRLTRCRPKPGSPTFRTSRITWESWKR